MRQQIRSSQTKCDGTRWSGCLHHTVATGTSELGPDMTDDLVAGRNPFQLLRDIFAEPAQLASTARAAILFRLVQDDFAWKIFRKGLAS